VDKPWVAITSFRILMKVGRKSEDIWQSSKVVFEGGWMSFWLARFATLPHGVSVAVRVQSHKQPHTRPSVARHKA
jgi:hypothetical protein